MRRDDLAKLVAPIALPQGDGAPPGPGSKGFNDTLNAGLMIGLFERDGDLVRLHPELPDGARDRRQRDRELPSLIRDLVLREALNHDLWASTEGARDLTRALAWYLAQNPLQPPAPWNEPGGVHIAEERQFASGERIFANDTRWEAFERWATFLGFACRMPRGAKDVLVPDPTDVLRSIVPSVLTTERKEIGPLIEDLGSRLPVLDRGSYRRQVEARMKPQAVQGNADMLSPSLAHALLRLRDEQVIVLENLADAPLKVRLPDGFGRRQERTLTHASLPSGKPRAGR